MPMNSHVAFGLCIALFAVNAHAGEKRLDRTFTVSPGGKLLVDSDGGNVTVNGTEGDQVVVHILMTGSDAALERTEMSADQSSDGVSVQTRHSGGWRNWFGESPGATVTVTVPKNYNVDLKTSGGNLAVSQLQGDSVGTTSGGDVRVADVRGAVKMRTSGGSVHVERVGGETWLRTSGGNVVVQTADGSVDAETSGGGIRVEQIKGATIAHTSSGDVVARNITGDVDLQSSGGRILAQAVDGKIRAGTSGGDVDVELIGANRGIVASTSGGSIALRMSRAIGGVLDASTTGGSVSSDLPVATNEASGTRLKGTINGGGPSIQARTSGGNVRIKARD